MFVMTVDQQGSRTSSDRVPEVLEWLTAWPGANPGAGRPAVLAFERTVGDEVQAVFDDVGTVVQLTLDLVRRGGWSIGIGCGPVDELVAGSARASSGPAFVFAREAVETAKTRSRQVPVAVRGSGGPRAAEAEAVLTLVGALAQRRTGAGWEAIDALRRSAAEATVGAVPSTELRQQDVAIRLGVSQQAVSQRLRTALWAEELAVRPVLSRLLDEAQG